MKEKREHKLISVRASLILLIMGLILASGAVTSLVGVLVYNLIPYVGDNPRGWYFFIGLTFFVLFSFLLSFFFSKLWLKKTEEVAHAAKEVAHGNYSVKVRDNGRLGEISDLIRAFNDMTEELSHVEMFRSDFINYFSHEFKTPIVSVRGFARQLENPDLPEETRAEYLRIIIEECDRLTRLSQNVLLLSRLENQTIVTDIATFPLDEVIRHDLLVLERAWTEKEIDLEIDMDEVTYTGNQEFMSLLFSNLLSNAIKFSPRGGRISVLLKAEGSGFRASVGDCGVGMDEETVSHIFDKFYQGDPSHKSAGNGLGLSLVKRITELAGMEISVTSAPGEGSVFTVTYRPALPR